MFLSRLFRFFRLTVQNEPNSGPAGRDTAWGMRDERAKQTQFLREWNDMQMPLRKEVLKNPANQRRRKNKPKSEITAGTAVVLMGKMPMLRNALRRLPAPARG